MPAKLVFASFQFHIQPKLWLIGPRQPLLDMVNQWALQIVIHILLKFNYFYFYFFCWRGCLGWLGLIRRKGWRYQPPNKKVRSEWKSIRMHGFYIRSNLFSRLSGSLWSKVQGILQIRPFPPLVDKYFGIEYFKSEW